MIGYFNICHSITDSFLNNIFLQVCNFSAPSVTLSTHVIVSKVLSLIDLCVHAVQCNWEDYEFGLLNMPLNIKFKILLCLLKNHQYPLTEKDLHCFFEEENLTIDESFFSEVRFFSVGNSNVYREMKSLYTLKNCQLNRVVRFAFMC